MTSSRALRPRSAAGILFAVVIACAGLASACAERIGRKAASGAIAELQRQHDQNPDSRPMKVAAASAAEGAVEALDTPEQRARIERMLTQVVAGAIEALDTPAQRARIERMLTQAAEAAADTAVEEATRQMVVQLGTEGQGPLAISLSRTGERFATSAASGVGAQLATLVPDCTGPDQFACIEQRLQRTARSTAASFTAGIKESIGWQLLLVAFVLGAGGGLLAAWLWSLRHERRRSLRLA